MPTATSIPNPVPVTQRPIGLAPWILSQWPEWLAPAGTTAKGDVLYVPLRDGSTETTAAIQVIDEMGVGAQLLDGAVRDRMLHLAKTDDIEWMLADCDVSICWDDASDKSIQVSCGQRQSLAGRVWDLVRCCQAVMDYQTGLESQRVGA